jgi:hypothetical protein
MRRFCVATMGASFQLELLRKIKTTQDQDESRTVAPTRHLAVLSRV